MPETADRNQHRQSTGPELGRDIPGRVFYFGDPAPGDYPQEAKIWPNDKILTGFYPKLHKPEIVPEIRKFVKEQMVEYLGEEEATLIDFVMNHLGKHENSNGFKGKNVDGLLEEMKMVLEEDAEAFVVDLFKKVVDISLE